VVDDQDSRSSLSIGLDWSARVTSIGLEFCVPAVLGYFADRWLKTTPWLTTVGALLGMGVGMLHVLRLPGELAKAQARTKRNGRRDSGGSSSRDVPD
jgi:ATP synthase protein I